MSGNILWGWGQVHFNPAPGLPLTSWVTANKLHMGRCEKIKLLNLVCTCSCLTHGRLLQTQTHTEIFTH